MTNAFPRLPWVRAIYASAPGLNRRTRCKMKGKKKRLSRSLKRQNKQLKSLNVLKGHWPDLPDDIASALIEARRRCGFPERTITSTSSHSTIMAHFNLVLSAIGVRSSPNGNHRKPARSEAAVLSDDFLQSYEWRRLRYKVLLQRGRRCECCGRTPNDGIQCHVDHIRPRKRFPQLALEESNLQILCHECNHGKGNWDQTDWREKEAELGPERTNT